MNERLLKLRKTLKLSQEKFGKELGVTGAGISKIESGERSLTDTMIKLVCSTHNVNEKWLRTGEGEMFNMNEDEQFSKFLGSLFKNENSFKKKAVRALSKLNDDQWEMLETLVDELSRED